MITTKRPELEDKAVLHAKIKGANEYVPLERLYLSPSADLLHARLVTSLLRRTVELRLVKEVAEGFGKELKLS